MLNPLAYDPGRVSSFPISLKQEMRAWPRPLGQACALGSNPPPPLEERTGAWSCMPPQQTSGPCVSWTPRPPGRVAEHRPRARPRAFWAAPGTSQCRAKAPCTHLHILLDGLEDAHVELPHGDGGQVRVAEQAVDDLQQRLLHAREPLLQQLRGHGRVRGTRAPRGAPQSPGPRWSRVSLRGVRQC